MKCQVRRLLQVTDHHTPEVLVQRPGVFVMPTLCFCLSDPSCEAAHKHSTQPMSYKAKCCWKLGRVRCSQQLCLCVHTYPLSHR
jgi:hypothetical protein